MKESNLSNIRLSEMEVSSQELDGVDTVFVTPVPINWFREAGIIDAALSAMKERDDCVFVGINARNDFVVSDESMRGVVETAQKTEDAPLLEALMDFAHTGNSDTLWKVAYEDESRIYARDFLNETMYRCSLPFLSDETERNIREALEEESLKDKIPGITELDEEDRDFILEELRDDFLPEDTEKRLLLQDWSENIIRRLENHVPEGDLRDEFIASVRKGAEKYMKMIENQSESFIESDNPEVYRGVDKIYISSASFATNPFNGERVGAVMVTHETPDGEKHVGYITSVMDGAGCMSISGGVMNLTPDGISEISETLFTPLVQEFEKTNAEDVENEEQYEDRSR